jgi:YacP-like NYN domain-containing protein
MKRFWIRHARSFDDVVRIARSVVRDLDLDDLPPALRPVERYSGGRLPPPLAGALLNAIVENDWFREQIADRGPFDNPLVQGFVDQPTSWWQGVATRIVESEAAASDALNRKQADELRAAATQLGEAKRRIEALRKELTAAEKLEDVDGKIDGLRRRLRDLERTNDADRRASMGTAVELQIARKESATLREDRENARSEVRKLKAERATMLRQIESGEIEHDRSDPVRFARELDQLVALSSGSGPVGSGGSSDAAGAEIDRPPSLPPGARPDSDEAVEWLLDHAPRSRWVIDGYNLSFALGKAMADPAEARREVERRLSRLARRASSGSVLVVFDSTKEGERAVRSGRLVDIVFAPSHQSADDAIVERSAAPYTVVVSNDRELRERSEERGALVLWSDALVAWLG